MRIVTETVHSVDYHELDQLIIKEFNLEAGWTVVCCWEQGNDSSRTVDVSEDGVDEKELLATINKEKLYAYPAIDNYGAPTLFMIELARRDKIPYGKYIVKVCW